MSRRLPACAALAAIVALLVAAAAPAQARPMRMGFMDDSLLMNAGPGAIVPWWNRARAVDTDLVRLNIRWRVIGPQRPPSAGAATDPNWAGYDFDRVDEAMRQATSRGIGVLLNVYSAPSWAEGGQRPRSAPAGTWRPSAAAYGRFATAVARRYSGAWPDPTRPGATLPKAAGWQAWNEPNLPTYLTPQWRGRGRTLRAESPRIYRGLLNAFYAAVKRVDRRATVVTAGTAPYGDPPGRGRMMPARFVRELLCVRGTSRFRRGHCRSRAHFDVLAHHPYSVGGPARHALNADDVNVPDLARLTRPLRAAERLHTIRPAKRKRLWITELSWDSSPPDPDGVPVRRHARWLEEATYRLWRQGAEALIWLNIGDAPPRPSYAATYQSGVFFAGGRAKPAARAFAFPFVTDCRRTRAKRRCVAWLKTSARTAVTIERRTRGRWKRVMRTRTNGDGLVHRSVAVPRHSTLRARTATTTSLTWFAR